MTRAYYNENDAFAAEWLRQLMWADVIAPGDVDERSIEDVTADDLRGYDQHHFFAGIGVWSAALRLAGWPDDRPVWTGSCPCQPFSEAGRRGGTADKRHLWPAWWWLVQQHRPSHLFGEQVASKDGLAWFDAVSTDLEAAQYAVAAADLCAAGIGLPHQRQRLYFTGVAGPYRPRWGSGVVDTPSEQARFSRCPWEPGSTLANGDGERQPERSECDSWSVGGTGGQAPRGADPGGRGGERSPLANDHGVRLDGRPGLQATAGSSGWLPPKGNDRWSRPDWVLCRDGKRRPVEPGTFPLAHGVAGRVGHLRGYGNCIAYPLAATFIAAVMDCLS